MAKRRKEKDEEEEDQPFKMPKFDEEAFLKKKDVISKLHLFHFYLVV